VSSAAAPMTTNGMADCLDPAKIFRRSSCLRLNHGQDPDFDQLWAPMDRRAEQGGRLQLVGGTRPGSRESPADPASCALNAFEPIKITVKFLAPSSGQGLPKLGEPQGRRS
jgi:hypothetical protein